MEHMANVDRGGTIMPARKQHVRKPAPTGTKALVHKDGPQVVRSTGKRWSDAAEAVFLDHLAASCNVSFSAAQAGFSAVAIYARRRRDPAFARGWQRALEQGCARIETALIRAAAESAEGRDPDPDTPIPKMTVKEALMVLGQARRSLEDGRRTRRGVPRPRSLADVRESILSKLEIIESARLRAGGAPLPLLIEQGKTDGER
jgi:hypothetical protein